MSLISRDDAKRIIDNIDLFYTGWRGYAKEQIDNLPTAEKLEKKMGVLIKGMEIPFCCLACPCSGTDNADDDNEVWVCEASKLRQLTVEDRIEQRPEWCPLVPVPPHGDLIDREAWKKSVIDEGETIGIDGFSIDGLSVDDVCCAIENAPVAIPAETKKVKDAVANVIDDPSHPFADGVMMKE